MREADRDAFVVGAWLCRGAVAGILGVDPCDVVISRSCPDCEREHGKPVVVGAPVHVSVSHSRELVAVAATTSGPVGVDVEFIDPSVDLRSVARHVGIDPVGTSDRDIECFYRTWVRKESCVKATGEGLRRQLSEVVVSPADEPAALISYAGAPLAAWIGDFDVGPGYAAAVCILPIR
ncbi:MAG TPA: 4'-phosphopantetheinyl transferase superfamily protein [Acidimicrobiales bacterium]|nr:4'-phosphopantetheinyl transferase superfamily protein [Acidimicrobiales bacterium]